MVEMTVADVLERAADMIEPEGRWTQRDYGSPETSMCAKAAIFNASRRFGGDRLVAAAAFDKVAALVPDGGPHFNPVVLWNDAPERTQAEVVAKLREAAALARSHSSVEGGER